MKDREKAANALDVLETFAADFDIVVSAFLRRLGDQDINRLHLLTHTGWNMGEDVHVWTAVLMPLIDKEAELRRHIEMMPSIGPICAPDLYRKGGGHYVPF